MLGLMRGRERLEMVVDQVGTPTSARSLGNALWGFALMRTSGLFHYCDGGSASRHSFAVAIQDEAHALGLLASKIPIDPIASIAYPAPARRPAYSVLDSSRAWGILGRRPAYWRDNLRETLEEIRWNG